MEPLSKRLKLSYKDDRKDIIIWTPLTIHFWRSESTLNSLKSVFNAIRRKPPPGAPEKTTTEFSFVFIYWKSPAENAGDGNSETPN